MAALKPPAWRPVQATGMIRHDRIRKTLCHPSSLIVRGATLMTDMQDTCNPRDPADRFLGSGKTTLLNHWVKQPELGSAPCSSTSSACGLITIWYCRWTSRWCCSIPAASAARQGSLEALQGFHEGHPAQN